MNTMQIACFLEVAHHLSFARAAEVLYISQPVVSYQIKAMEDELGIRLFARSNRSVALTEAGAYLYTRLGSISRQLGEVVSTAKAIQDRERSVIMLLVRRLTDYSDLTRSIKAFSETHPSVQVDIFPLGDSNVCKLLLSGEIQLAFCYQYEIPGNSKLKFLPLKKINYYVLAGKGHRLTAFKELQMKDLTGERLLLADSELQKNGELISRNKLNALGIEMPPAYGTFDGMLLSVESGVGITILPCGVQKRFSGLAKIRVRDLPHTCIGLAWDANAASPAVLDFVKMARG